MMPEADFDQRIVQEVLRRLMDTTSPQNTVATRPLGIAFAAPVVSADHGLANCSAMGRLITLESIRGLEPGISRIQLDSRAVVTPAAVDELRRLGIAVLRSGDKNTGDKSSGDQNSGDKMSAPVKKRRRWLLATTCSKFSRPDVMIDAQRLEWYPSADLRKVMGECSRVLHGRFTAAVVYSQSPALVACLLNRNSHVRAMAARGVLRLTDEVKTCHANALVVDIHQSGAEQWQCVDLFANALAENLDPTT